MLLILLLSLPLVWGTPLDDYVAKPDPTYSWKIVRKLDPWNMSATAYILEMTSQTWLTPKDSSQPVWKHWLSVCVPHDWLWFGPIGGEIKKGTQMEYPTATIYMNDGHNPLNEKNPPSTIDPMVEALCLGTKAVAAELHQIPNEPITFADGKKRSEDGIIAYTWKHFLDNPNDPTWLLRMPMTKAGVRAMDTIEALMKQLGGMPVNEFIIAGASKRGWTTWTVGAVDGGKRVKAIVPMVIDVLNLKENVKHMWKAYGAWSFAFQDYVDAGVTKRIDDPNLIKLMDIVDPITYVHMGRLNMPKLVVCSTGDEFFLPDDPQFFWKDLQGESHLRMVPNAEHSLAGHAIDLTLEISAFVQRILGNVKRPLATWDLNSNNISVVTDTLPVRVRKWKSHNPKARDFRLLTGPDIKNFTAQFWFAEEVKPDPSFKGSGYRYVTSEPVPSQGWLGYFMELDYGNGMFKHTTEVKIVPDALPYPWCGNACP